MMESYKGQQHSAALRCSDSDRHPAPRSVRQPSQDTGAVRGVGAPGKAVAQDA